VTRRVASTRQAAAPAAQSTVPLPSGIERPGTVFTSVTASAPSPWATRAIDGRSGSTGESLTLRGREEARRQARTNSLRLQAPPQLEAARAGVRAGRVDLEAAIASTGEALDHAHVVADVAPARSR